MLNERYQVSAIPLVGGDRIVWFLIAAQENRAFITQSGMSIAIYKHKSAQLEKIVEVDPATIEPVGVSPVIKGYEAYCPNCGNNFAATRYLKEICTERPYCEYCGQRLG